MSTEVRGLEGMTVLEVAESSLAVGYCGLVLAQLGATVIKVEPPGGDPARHVPPFVDPGDPTNAGALFLYLSRGKRSLVLDLDTPEGASRLRELARHAHILVDDLDPAEHARLGLDNHGLAATDIVHVGIRPFGAFGELAEVPATPLTVAHAGGESFINPSGLEHLDRPPLKLAGHAQEFDSGAVAALVALAGIHEGPGAGYRYCDLSEQDVQATMVRPEIVTAFATGVEETRATRVHEFGGPLRCADGWVHVVIKEADQWNGLVELMGSPEWAIDPRYQTREARFEDGYVLTQEMSKWLLTQQRHDLMRRAQDRGVPIVAIETPLDVLETEQLHQRGFLQELRAGGRNLRAPSPIAAPTPAAPQSAARAPLLGEHNSEVLQQRPSHEQRTPHQPQAPGPGPLAGVRVLELASVWAGPCSGMLMAFLGATVIKVESSSRPDLTRRSGVNLDSSPSFHLANLGKKSVLLEIDRPEDAETFLQLCAESDVVITNVQQPSLGRRGLAYEDCSGRNPRLIWGQISTSGSEGPERHYKGYAPSFNALSGLSSLTGYEDGPPAEMRSGGDMRVAYDLTLSIIAALIERGATRKGKFIDLSCREVLTARIGDQLLNAEIEGPKPRIGNDHPHVVPAAVYPTADDQWLALEIGDDETWARFVREALSVEPDPGLSRREGRLRNREQVDKLVASWSLRLPVDEAVRRARELGVAASRSMSNMQLAGLSHLWQRRLFFERPAPQDLGPKKLVGAPWSSSANAWPSLSAAIQLPVNAPRLGEHTDEVLHRLRQTRVSR